ncbi:MAG: hypothetical protein FJW27_05840 [Acidimicrobiia bacterium]|nr:hypothetical protein [Acidimicrobiia bacterium]
MLPASMTALNLFAMLESLNVPEPLWIAVWGLGLFGASMLCRSLSDRRGPLSRHGSTAAGRA